MIWKALWPAALTAFGASLVVVVLWGDRRESKGFERGYAQAQHDRLIEEETTRERVRNADTSSGDPCADEQFIRDALGWVPGAWAGGTACPR